MQLHELQQQIISNKLDKLYMFTGEEIGIMDIYIDKINTVGGYTISRLDAVQEAYSKMIQRRISGQPRCFIVRDDKEFLKNEKIWETVKDACISSTDMLIILYTNLDKRSKFYKTYKDDLIVFDKLDGNLLAKYIKNQIDLATGNAAFLAGMCEFDYNRILLECDKIKQYASAFDNRLSYDQAFLHLKDTGVIHQPIGDITFKFTDAIATRDYANIAKYLLQAKAKNEPEIMVLSILYNTFKQILLVQGLGSDKTNASQRTGLSSWQVGMATQKMGHYTISELMGALKTIRFVEKSIKTGQIESDIALEYLIVNII